MAKRRFSSVLFGIFALVLSVSFLASCDKNEKDDTKGSTDDKNEEVETETKEEIDLGNEVVFMIRSDNKGEYKEYERKTIEKGKVTLPEDPAKEGYRFVNWYYDKECSKVFVPTAKIEKGMYLYGLLVEKTIKVTVLKITGKVELGEKALSSLTTIEEELQAEAAGLNLVLDGWYTNEECTTKYDESLGATEIYARHMAKVTFDNGYETVLEKLVVPNTVLEEPKVADVKKDYMSEKDIFFVGEDGVDVDFSQAITKNTTISVEWKTDCLNVVEKNGQYMIIGFDGPHFEERIASYPVIRIPNRVTVTEGQGEEAVTKVVNILNVGAGDLYQAASARKIIFGEGILYLSGLNTLTDNVLEEVILPSSLKVIENAFNGYDQLKKVTLPEGLEVIIDSFWKNYRPSDDKHTSGYDFEIVVPASVTNISLVPANLTYAKGSLFSNEGQFVIKNDENLGKTLVSVQSPAVVDGTLSIPEGFEAIQVGALNGLAFEYLNLPESFTKVSYNNDRALYEGYLGDSLTEMDLVAPTANPTKSKVMSKDAYTIVSDLANHQYIKFSASAYPTEMNKYAFTSGNTPFDQLDQTICIFIKEVSEGTIEVLYKYTNLLTSEVIKDVVTLDYTATPYTSETLLEALGLTTATVGYKFSATFEEFGKPLSFEKAFNTNKYLDIKTVLLGTGVTYELTQDKLAYVAAGFDESSALLLENGLYLITIQDTYKDLPVIGVKAHAFEGAKGELIAQVKIAKSVKEIGEYAFAKMENLEKVTIETGGLEVIGKAAFQYAGAISQEVEVPTINPALENGELAITLPLGNLKTVSPLAFDSPAIKRFTKTSEEKSRKSFGMLMSTAGFEEGQFYFNGDNGIVKILNTIPAADGKLAETMCDYVATAAGTDGKIVFGCAVLGFAGGKMGHAAYFRFNVKEGSVTRYSKKGYGIGFGIVGKVEANAFGYLDPYYTTPNEKSKNRFEVVIAKREDHTQLTSLEDVTSQNSEIFEEGWFNGRANSLNETMMSQVDDYGDGTPHM